MARKRSRIGKAAKTARNLAIADAAIALARQGTGHHRRSRAKALLLGGAAAAIAAGALFKRDKVAGLLPSGGESAGPQSWTPAPTAGPSNYDAPGPVANTATPVPAPEAHTAGSVDEQ